MAVKRETVLKRTSDISSEEATENIQYSVNGIRYDIDLTASEAADFYAKLNPYISVSRLRGGGTKKKTRDEVNESVAIRAWAATVGIEVKPQGRIAGTVKAAYAEAKEAAQDAGDEWEYASPEYQQPERDFAPRTQPRSHEMAGSSA